MKRSVYDQEQDRKSKTRLRMVQHAETSSHNVSQTCRFFGISRGQFYIWRHRFKKKGVKGLRDMSRRPNKIRYRIPPRGDRADPPSARRTSLRRRAHEPLPATPLPGVCLPDHDPEDLPSAPCRARLLETLPHRAPTSGGRPPCRTRPIGADGREIRSPAGPSPTAVPPVYGHSRGHPLSRASSLRLQQHALRHGLPRLSPPKVTFYNPADSDRQRLFLRPSIHLPSGRPRNSPSPDSAWLPGSQRQGRTKPQNRSAGVLRPQPVQRPKRFNSQDATLGARIQRRPPSSCPRGQDSRRACSPFHPTIQTCQESLLTNTGSSFNRHIESCLEDFHT